MKFNFNTNALYRRTPKPNEQTWCRNFTYKAFTYDNGETWFMGDTYFNNHNILVTEDNINEFEFVFDFDEVKEIDRYTAEEYEEEDIFRVPVDSSGLYLGSPCFVKKEAQKSIPKIIAIITDEIKNLEQQLEWKKKELLSWSIESKNE